MADEPVGAHTTVAPGKRTLTQSLPAAGAVNKGAGTPLDPGIAAHVGGMLDADFGDVRVHGDAAAHRATDAMGARAFAQGTDIFLGAGESGTDLGLMAHELTHVVQQGGVTSAPQAKSRSGGSGGGGDLEREADMVAERALGGDALDWLIGPAPAAPRVQLKEKPEIVAEGSTPRTGFLLATDDTFLHCDRNGVLVPTLHAIRATNVVRERPIPPGTRHHLFTYVVTAGEMHGWAKRSFFRAVPPELVEDADASLGEGEPRQAMPSIPVDDYDKLAVMFWDAPVFGKTMPYADIKKETPIATIRQMETVVLEGKSNEFGTVWHKVRLMRGDAEEIVGFVHAPTANSIAPLDPTALAAPASGIDGSVYMKLHTVDPQVQLLETRLQALGYPVGTIDETFDEQTKAAVEAFQRQNPPLVVDGEFGPASADALARAEAKAKHATSGSDTLRAGHEEQNNAFAANTNPTSGSDALRGGAAGPPAAPSIPVGSWRGGYELTQLVHGRALTPDARPDHETHDVATQDSRSSMAKGPCEVLIGDDGEPVGVVDLADKERALCYYVRATSLRTHDVIRDEATDGALTVGGAGWVPAQYVIGTGSGELSPIAAELQQLCPDGITVAFVSNFDERESEQTLVFLREAAGFAATNNAVAISGGQVITGGVNLTTEKHEVVQILTTIQQTLRGGAADVPRWLRIAHLAFFTHGWQTGLQLGRKDVDGDHLMNQYDQAPYYDLEGWARTLTNYVHSDVKISMFACSTGENPNEEPGMWDQQKATMGGEGSFADEMADSLAAAGADGVRILGHTTIGHTTDNYASRLFEGGDDDGGHNLWNYVALPIDTWLADELAELVENNRADPPAELTHMAWNVFKGIISKDDPTQIQTRMNADPELFRIELRLRIKARLPHMFLEKGLLPKCAQLESKNESAIWPQYSPWPAKADMGQIPPHTRLRRQKGEAIWREDQWCYPITWDGDPKHAQAYLGRWWMIITIPDGI
jgi:hypothetical protein